MDHVTLSALAAFPQQLEALYAVFPTEFTHWVPPLWDGIPSERFTAIEQVCHVRDIEIDGYQVRFSRTLLESSPTLPSIDSESLARERSYATENAVEALAAFRAAREDIGFDFGAFSRSIREAGGIRRLRRPVAAESGALSVQS
jgi:hypothetical protein